MGVSGSINAKPKKLQCRKMRVSPVLIQLLLIHSFVFLGSGDAFTQNKIVDGKIDRGGFSLHYKILGEIGPYVIILGGGPGSNVDYMKPVADSLSRNFRCVMLEQRGTGRSVLEKFDSTTVHMRLYVEDIELLRKHLKSDKLILVGNSWGSLLALLYGIEYPGYTKSIISLGSSPISNDYANVFDDNFRLRLLPEEKTMRNQWKSKLQDSSTFLQANYERDKAGMPAYYYDREKGLKAANSLKITDFNYYILPAFDAAHSSFDIRPVLSKVKAPVLLVQGRQDLAGEANIIEISRLITNSHLKFIERCGHFPWEEKPTETWEIIYAFLAQYKYFR